MKLRRACQGQRSDGQPCRTAPLTDSDYCLWHSPEHAAAAQEARRLGGMRRRKEVTVGHAYEWEGLGSLADLRRLLEIAIVDTLSLENSVSRNRTLAYLSMVALKSLELEQIEPRLQALEAAVHPAPAANPEEELRLPSWLETEGA